MNYAIRAVSARGLDAIYVYVSYDLTKGVGSAAIGWAARVLCPPKKRQCASFNSALEFIDTDTHWQAVYLLQCRFHVIHSIICAVSDMKNSRHFGLMNALKSI